MGLQLIVVMETNKTCKSDWIYIKSTIERFYDYDTAHVKFSPVFMGGKTNYKDKQKDIYSLKNQYLASNKMGETIVIYCFDCDEYDTKREDSDFLEKVCRFCSENHYELVWFCKDIERVYLGRKVSDSMKKNEATKFMARKMINGVDASTLSSTSYRANTSNLLRILDKYMARKGSDPVNKL